MSGYTPVFDSIFQGTLYGKYPDTAAWLFLLALADRNGLVDMTPDYIAGVTGMPRDDLVACIERFMQPDPFSRTATDEGRRLELIEPGVREWGWRIVNHGKYREKARIQSKDAARIESGENAKRMKERRQRKKQTPGDPRRPPKTPSQTQTPDPQKTTSSSEEAPRAKNGSRFMPDPTTFPITAEMLAWAETEAPTVDIRAATQQWRRHEYPKPIRDPKRAWENWILKARDGFGPFKAKSRGFQG